jgi:hypothetical protein
MQAKSQKPRNMLIQVQCSSVVIKGDDKPQENEVMSHFLRRKKRLHELLLFAWGEVEFNIDQLVVGQYELPFDYNDKKVRFVLDKSFDRKLNFLRNFGVLSKDEFHTLHTFQEKRNDFFHSEGWTTLFTMAEEQKERIMDEAVVASELSTDLLFRQPIKASRPTKLDNEKKGQ